jgi:hypothetical protein
MTKELNLDEILEKYYIDRFKKFIEEQGKKIDWDDNKRFLKPEDFFIHQHENGEWYLCHTPVQTWTKEKARTHTLSIPLKEVYLLMLNNARYHWHC